MTRPETLGQEENRAVWLLARKKGEGCLGTKAQARNVRNLSQCTTTYVRTHGHTYVHSHPHRPTPTHTESQTHTHPHPPTLTHPPIETHT